MISRGLTAAQSDQFSGVFHPVVLVWIAWPSGDVRAHSGTRPILWQDQWWEGVGPFGEIDVPAEALGLGAFGAELSLFGLPESLLDLIDGPVRNRPAKIWLGTATEPGGSVLRAEPIELFDGYINAVKDRTHRQDGYLAYVVRVSLGVGPSARVGARITHSFEDQQAEFPGDTAGRHLARARDKAQRQTWPEE